MFARLNSLEAQFTAREPSLQAYVPETKRFSRLRGEVMALEALYPDTHHRPSLFGLFLGVKDIFHVNGFPTRAGSEIPPETLTGPEGDAIMRLKAAGALVVGKTVTTQFAYFAPGPTRNPHHPAHTPGGSSSGSAAAVAAELCDIALGTQTIGSINRPAAFCGVIGFKPSYDRIPRTGVIPLSPSVDHVGLFSRTLPHLEQAASVVCDLWTPPDKTRRPVLGIPEGPYLSYAEPEGLEHFWRTVARLEQAGFSVHRVPLMSDFAEISQRHHLIVAYDAALVHQEWFARYEPLYHPKTAELIRRGQQIPEAVYLNALEGRAQLRHELTSQMKTHGVDLWLSPSAPGPAPRGLESTGNPVMNLPWTHAGLPTLTLPAGKNSYNLPLGLQLTAGWYEDERLIAWANLLDPLLLHLNK
ncbi:MAG: amidase [Anaerolineales bacterium]